MSAFGVVLAAAGAGRRFGARKQLLELLGKPLLHYSLDVFAAVADVEHIVVVLAAEDLPIGARIVAGWRAAPGGDSRRRELPVVLTAGGARRQDSVRLGLEQLPAKLQYALVHDAARPLLEVDAVRRLVAATRAHGAAVIGTRAVDSVKRVVDGTIVAELPRHEVWSVQTPQSGEVVTLKRAHDAAGDTEMTDESSALRSLGVQVTLVEGSRENLKITCPEDVALAEAILRGRGR